MDVEKMSIKELKDEMIKLAEKIEEKIVDAQDDVYSALDDIMTASIASTDATALTVLSNFESSDDEVNTLLEELYRVAREYAELKEIENETLELDLVEDRADIYDNVQCLLSLDTPDNIREILESFEKQSVNYDDTNVIDELTFNVSNEMEKQGISQEVIDKFYDVVQCDHAINKNAKTIYYNINRLSDEDERIAPPIILEDREYYVKYNKEHNTIEIEIIKDSLVGEWDIPFSKEDIRDLTIEDIEELIRSNLMR